MSITAASASEQAQLDEAAALARATVDAANLNAKASVAGFSLFSHGGFPAGRGTYRNAPTYAEAAVALELSESIEKLLLDDFDDEC